MIYLDLLKPSVCCSPFQMKFITIILVAHVYLQVKFYSIVQVVQTLQANPSIYVHRTDTTINHFTKHSTSDWTGGVVRFFGPWPSPLLPGRFDRTGWFSQASGCQHYQVLCRKKAMRRLGPKNWQRFLKHDSNWNQVYLTIYWYIINPLYKIGGSLNEHIIYISQYSIYCIS